jgi:hypothetical protein
MAAPVNVAEQWVLASQRVLNHVGVTTMKRLDQGHLLRQLKVPRLTCPGRESNTGHSNSLFNCYSEPSTIILDDIYRNSTQLTFSVMSNARVYFSNLRV